MVKSFKNQWGETGSGGDPTKYTIVFVVIIIFILGFLVFAYLNRPVTTFEVGPAVKGGENIVTITAINEGTLREQYIDLALTTTPRAECILVDKGEGCQNLRNSRLLCEYLGPGDGIGIECQRPENGTVYYVYMKSKYQTSKLEWTCSADKCHPTDSYLHGSFPVAWNYLLAYPADMLISISNALTEWVYPE